MQIQFIKSSNETCHYTKNIYLIIIQSAKTIIKQTTAHLNHTVFMLKYLKGYFILALDNWHIHQLTKLVIKTHLQ